MRSRFAISVVFTILMACTSKHVIEKGGEPFVEEFKVGDLTVRAYQYSETNEGWGTLYRFAVYEDGQRIRDIVVEWHDIFGRGYFLEESFDQGHITYELYHKKPKYSLIKPAVKEILKED